MKAPLQLSCGVRTDPGRARSGNEDNYFVDAERGIFGVIDGVGGHNAGEVAAALGTEEVRARLVRREGAVADALREGIALANKKIFETAQGVANLEGMACVLSAVVIEPGRLTIGHVGDTRVYKIRDREIVKLTRDHSPVGEREDRGELSELEAMRHPRRNEVYRDVGTEPRGPHDPEFIEIIEAPFEIDAALVLCTDGLTDLVTSGQILETVLAHAGDPEAAASALVDKALEAGGKDNVTVLVVEAPRFAGRQPAHLEEVPTRRLRTTGERTAPVIPLPASGSTAGRDPVPVRRTGPQTPRESAAQRRPAQTAPLERAVVARADSSSSQANHAPVPERDERRRPPSLPWPARLPGWVLPLIGLALAVALIGTWLFRSVTRKEPAPPPMIAPVAPAAVPPPRYEYRVEPPGRIRDALEQARPGWIIVVAPGEYLEDIALKSGVTLMAAETGKVVLNPVPPEDAGRPIVSATDVRDARLVGFVVGKADNPRQVGIDLNNSQVDLDDVRVVGTTVAAVRLEGTARPLLRRVRTQVKAGEAIRVAPGSSAIVIESGPEPRAR